MTWDGERWPVTCYATSRAARDPHSLPVSDTLGERAGRDRPRSRLGANGQRILVFELSGVNGLPRSPLLINKFQIGLASKGPEEHTITRRELKIEIPARF